MISILITAWKEEKTIGRCINSVANPEYSGISEDFEILLACPDEETLTAALQEVEKLGLKSHFRHIQDPCKGKPHALNMLMDEAQGDLWVFTDGDVYYKEGSVKRLLSHFKEDEVKMVTGRPISGDERTTMLAYFGHLLADAAHHKRTIDLTANPVGKSLRFVKKRLFFPVSGYIYAMRKTDIRFPEDTLVDDAYISYAIFNNGGKIVYEPEAVAYVKYPRTMSDYFKQKKRSTGGYMQLWEYGVVRAETKTRSFWRELEYFWFPLAYAKNPREFLWSLCLYPMRLWLWLQIFWERKILKKDFVRTWVRVESTK